MGAPKPLLEKLLHISYPQTGGIVGAWILSVKQETGRHPEKPGWYEHDRVMGNGSQNLFLQATWLQCRALFPFSVSRGNELWQRLRSAVRAVKTGMQRITGGPRIHAVRCIWIYAVFRLRHGWPSKKTAGIIGWRSPGKRSTPRFFCSLQAHEKATDRLADMSVRPDYPFFDAERRKHGIVCIWFFSVKPNNVQTLVINGAIMKEQAPVGSDGIIWRRL